ncbi:MAG: bacteriocin immunity protein [Escherichia coli]
MMRFTTGDNIKEKFEDYTEEEFLIFRRIEINYERWKASKGKELEMYWDSLVDHFIEITQHPSGSDLIFYPKSQGDDKPENILKNCQRMAAFTGVTLFKDSK